MKSAVVALLPCLWALSLYHVARAQTISEVREIVTQLIETVTDGIGFPLSGSCPQLNSLSDECRRQFIGGLGSDAFAICTGECYERVLEAYQSCSDSGVITAGLFVHLLQAGNNCAVFSSV
jgi:hypothetical protein